MRSVARSAGLVTLVPCSRGSRPGLYAVARSARFLTRSAKPGGVNYVFAVETVLVILAVLISGLKPGVNERKSLRLLRRSS